MTIEIPDSPASRPDLVVVTGVSLLDPNQTRPVLHWPIRASALFGLNGSGKSRILRHIGDCLSGRGVDGEEFGSLVHVAGRGDLASSGGLGWHLWEALRAALGAASEPSTDAVQALLRRAGAPDDFADLVAEQGRWTLAPDDAGFLVEIAVWFPDTGPLADFVTAVAALLPEPASDEVPAVGFAGRSYVKWPGHDLAESLAGEGLANDLLAAAVAVARDPAAREWGSWPLLRLGGVVEPRIPAGAVATAMGLLQERPLPAVLVGLARDITEGRRWDGFPPAEQWEGLGLDVTLNGLASRASELLSDCLPSAPRLALKPAPASSGMLPVVLAGVDRRSGESVAFEEMSGAEQRWAVLALQIAAREAAGSSRVLMMDEPENGLHPLARRTAAQGLAAWRQQTGIEILLATHDPDFLDIENFDRWRVARAAGLSQVDRIDDADLLAWMESSDGEGVGLRPSDLLLNVRVLVFVEGAHDAALLRTWLPGPLASARAKVVAFRGTGNLDGLLDLSALFEFSAAPALIVVDNTRAAVGAAWQRVRAGGHWRPEAKRLRRIQPTAEEESLLKLLGTAWSRNQAHRLHAVGLEQPDVICYLPPAAFGETSRSWPQLLREWQSAREKHGKTDPGRDKPLKHWLREELGWNPSTSNLIRAALDAPVPPEWEALGRTIEALAARPLAGWTL